MAPNVAMVNAGPTSPRTSESDTDGSFGCGNARSMTPNRLPIVSTGKVEQLHYRGGDDQRDHRAGEAPGSAAARRRAARA